MFYANLRISKDSRELETLVLGIRIILNDILFEKVFDNKFSSVVPFMNRTLPEDFEVSCKEAKTVVVEPEVNFSNLGPLSLCFKH